MVTQVVVEEGGETHTPRKVKDYSATISCVMKGELCHPHAHLVYTPLRGGGGEGRVGIKIFEGFAKPFPCKKKKRISST